MFDRATDRPPDPPPALLLRRNEQKNSAARPKARPARSAHPVPRTRTAVREMPRNNNSKQPPARPMSGTAAPHTPPNGGARSKPPTGSALQTRQTDPRAPAQPPRATYVQRADPNAAILCAKTWHFGVSASSSPVVFSTSSGVPTPAPINPDSLRLDLASLRVLLACPAPPPSADASVAALAASRRRQLQVLV